MAEFDMPLGHEFRACLPDLSDDDYAFAEVDGLPASDLTQGGAAEQAGAFPHSLPGAPQHGNIRLKRLKAQKSSSLVRWLKETLEGDFSRPVQTRNLRLSLTDTAGKVLAEWEAANVWPVKWSVDVFGQEADDLRIDLLELAYQSMSRQR